MKTLRALLFLLLFPVLLLAETPSQVDFLIGGLTDSSGSPLNLGKVYTYACGTTTNKTTWQDGAKAVTHANPIVLDSQGKKLAFADGCYKFRIDNSADATQYTLDNLRFGEYGGGTIWGGIAGGSANALTITLSPALLALNDGAIVNFIAASTNTSATVTISVNGLAATNIRKSSGEGLQPEDIVSGRLYTIVYQSSTGYFVLQNPTGGWTTWTPTLTPAASMTYSGSSTTYASYRQVGKTIYYKISFTGTVGGTPATYIRFTLPVTPSATSAPIGYGYVFDNGSFASAMVLGVVSTATADCYRYNNVAFTAGTVTCVLSGFYEGV